MSLTFFPDTTVLVNFGILDNFALLDRLMGGSGRWCATVAMECDESVRYWPPMTAAASIFGEPLLPTAAEHVDIKVLRTQMASPGDPPHQHLGEAETIAIISSRNLAQQSIFVTDDRGAAGFAGREKIQTVTTWDLIRLACRANLLTDQDGWTAAKLLKQEGRGWPPCGRALADFVAWAHA